MLKGLDVSKVFIHDIKTTSSFDREEKWSGAEYGFSHLNSLGSRTIMGSCIKDLSETYWEWKNKPGNKMNGVGVAPKGGHHEPIVLEAMGELAWQDTPTDGDEWFQQYAERRYGLAVYNRALSAEEIQALAEKAMRAEPALRLTRSGNTLSWAFKGEEAEVTSYAVEYYNEEMEPVSTTRKRARQWCEQ